MEKRIIHNLIIYHTQIFALLSSTMYQQEKKSTNDIFFFLLYYNFLLQDNEINHNSCNLKTTHFLDPKGNGENGARYLDPKYSRWLSTDPALTSYAERNYNGPSGGIYNSVNLNLYHYGGNNPIKYVDPDGREDVYSVKCGENLYTFSADSSTIEGAIKSLFGIIPFVGGFIYEGINRAFGYKTIDEDTAYSKLKILPVLY